MLHYSPDRDFLIKKHLHDGGQTRNPNYIRKNIKKFNALADNEYLKNEVFQLNSEIFSDFCDFYDDEINDLVENDHHLVKKNTTEIDEINNNLAENIIFPQINQFYEEKEEEETPPLIELKKKKSDTSKSFKHLLKRKPTTSSDPMEKNEERIIERDHNTEMFGVKMFDYRFDGIKNYRFYFVDGNIENILAKLHKTRNLMKNSLTKKKIQRSRNSSPKFKLKQIKNLE